MTRGLVTILQRGCGKKVYLFKLLYFFIVMTKITDFEIIDRCLFLEKEKILIVGDLHLGYEEYLMEHGWSFPKTQLEITTEIFSSIFKKTGKLNKIILLGDVKHHFAGILKSEFGDFYSLVSLFRENLIAKGKVVICKGNHDNILEPVVRNYDFVELVDYFSFNEYLFMHGDKNNFKRNALWIADGKVKALVLGHFHPAVTLHEKLGVKKEKYKCFLHGLSKEFKKNIFFLPSFFPLIEGTDISKRDGEDDFLDKIDINNFNVYVLPDASTFNEKVYDFGKVKKLG